MLRAIAFLQFFKHIASSLFSLFILEKKGGGVLEYPCLGPLIFKVPCENSQSSSLMIFYLLIFSLTPAILAQCTFSDIQEQKLLYSFWYPILFFLQRIRVFLLNLEYWFTFLSFAIPLPSTYSATLHYVRPGREMTLKVKFFPKFSFN